MVSGGGTGVGKQIAHTLAGQGDRVVIIGRRRELLAQARAEINEATGTDHVADTLVGRAGTPADVAAAIRYITSPEAGYLTGQIIGLNGGAVLGR
ncbi:hypothetical protein GCM10023170_093650 [Phytohabitans houttuyneae]|uniref:Ketoreductase (KR) domain-containing protein n=1 Tax=Phytohabitans houttuyneae TaxID=1076126 RepID=A0A6V8KMP1_9ACTN|nr:hypothetical protein Phou_078610 [Phytohabitans houttuyneae]